jgi:hypothetical protein
MFLDPDGNVQRTVSFIHQLSARYPSVPEMTEFVNIRTREAEQARLGSEAPTVRAGAETGSQEGGAGVNTPQQP